LSAPPDANRTAVPLIRGTLLVNRTERAAAPKLHHIRERMSPQRIRPRQVGDSVLADRSHWRIVRSVQNIQPRLAQSVRSALIARRVPSSPGRRCIKMQDGSGVLGHNRAVGDAKPAG
jgi:hypothetical protein